MVSDEVASGTGKEEGKIGEEEKKSLRKRPRIAVLKWAIAEHKQIGTMKELTQLIRATTSGALDPMVQIPRQVNILTTFPRLCTLLLKCLMQGKWTGSKPFHNKAYRRALILFTYIDLIGR